MKRDFNKQHLEISIQNLQAKITTFDVHVSKEECEYFKKYVYRNMSLQEIETLLLKTKKKELEQKQHLLSMLYNFYL